MIENFWGVLKRSLRRMYGRLTLADLPDILKEWEQRQNNPEMFYTVDSYLRATAGLFGVGAVNLALSRALLFYEDYSIIKHYERTVSFNISYTVRCRA